MRGWALSDSQHTVGINSMHLSGTLLLTVGVNLCIWTTREFCCQSLTRQGNLCQDATVHIQYRAVAAEPLARSVNWSVNDKCETKNRCQSREACAWQHPRRKAHHAGIIAGSLTHIVELFLVFTYQPHMGQLTGHV